MKPTFSQRSFLLGRFHLFHPFEKVEESENAGVCGHFHEVRVLDGVAGVSQRQPHPVGGELGNGVAKSQEVACGLGHLGRVEQQMTVGENTLGPFIGWILMME